MSSKSSPSLRINLIVMFFIACLVSQIPIVNIPFHWVVSSYHYLFHGLLGIISGGDFFYMEIFANGGGYAEVRGGMIFFIALFGFVGSAMVGVVMYYASVSSRNNSVWIFGLLNILTTLAMFMWASGWLTYTIMSVITALLFLASKEGVGQYVKPITAFIGIYIVITTLIGSFGYSVYHHEADVLVLAREFGLPYMVWDSLIGGISVMLLLALFVALQSEHEAIMELQAEDNQRNS